MIGVALAALKVQVAITRRNMMDLYWILLMPFFSVIFTSIMVHSGRMDLVGYALVAPLLIAIGQMGFYASAELMARDQWMQMLEPTVATPAPFFVVLLSRVAFVSSLGLFGFLESWLIARFAFGIEVEVFHPLFLFATLLATSFASTASALVLAAFCCLTRNIRTLQNTATYPLYVLGGVLVPATYLPEWLQPVSKLIFLSWSADLLRDSLQPAAISEVPSRIAAILLIGLVTGVAGAVLLHRMIDRLRKDGRLGLA